MARKGGRGERARSPRYTSPAHKFFKIWAAPIAQKWISRMRPTATQDFFLVKRPEYLGTGFLLDPVQGVVLELEWVLPWHLRQWSYGHGRLHRPTGAFAIASPQRHGPNRNLYAMKRLISLA